MLLSPCKTATDRPDDTLRFLEVIAPLIRQGQARLRIEAERLRQGHDAPFAVSTVVEALTVSLKKQLAAMLECTMVLELHNARQRRQLYGFTPAERFDSFIYRLSWPEVAHALLAEYPVLAMQAELHINRWVACSVEFLRHLCADWQTIRAVFRPENEPGPLVAVDAAGDRHRGGRTVLIAQFRSGWRLVYKPKSLAVEVHFQRLLAWLNEHGAHSVLRRTPVLNRGDHGWAAFVAARPCFTEAEVRRFSWRQGAYLALLYGLMTTDCHLENVLAAGEHPVVVDLETLFHRGPADAAGQRYADSVLGVGLLPQRFLFADKDEFVDLHSLDATDSQLSPGLVPCWEGSGTDEMRLVAWRAPRPGAANRPTLHGVEVNLLDYREDVIDGFRAMYHLLRERREELLADGGPLAAFANDEVRFLARTAPSYAMLLRQSYHPSLLRNARLRQRFFALLWADVKKSPWRARLRDAERSDLLRGDIPLFTTRPASRDLWTSMGERIANFFPHTGLELVRRRLQRLDQADLEKQLTIIRASFAGLSPRTEG